MTVKVILVGDANAPKNNRWEAMTNSQSEADRMMAEMGPESTTKTITVGPSRHKR
jgi:hypothetical protein